MKKLIILLFLLISSIIYSQFDSLIFQKYLYPYKYGVVALGDQNSDGCDDILIYDCNENKVSIYFGGSPMDTIPEFEFHIIQRSVVALDVNGDTKKDIVITYQDVGGSNQKGKVNIYYGGSLMDTMPDIHFETPEGSGYNFGWNMYVSLDFDGDSKEELIIYDADYPFNNSSQYGIFYIYKTSPFDTIPYHTIFGDTISYERLQGQNLTIGDLDGDGLSDISITGTIYPFESFIKFYKGNSGWNTEPFVTYYKNEHSFDPTRFRIIEDINGDNKDDILISSYGSFYPYYYLNSILYGNIPVDTIPDVGLNTQNTGIGGDNLIVQGDINGDGYNDLLATLVFGFGNGQARLWVGGNPMPEVPKQYWGGDYNGYGKLIGKVGDINGDGLDDICVGQCSEVGGCIPGFILIFAGDTLFQQPVNVDEMNYKADNYYLSEAYPNPFNPVTNLRFYIPQSGLVMIKIYDLLGSEVALLMNKEKLQGEYEFELNAVKYNLSSGVYFVKMEVLSGGSKVFQSTKKLILIK